MEKEYIISLSTIGRIKQKINFKIKFKLNKNKKIVKLKNLEFSKSIFVFDVSNFKKQIIKLKSIKRRTKNKYSLIIKHSPYLYLLEKYEILNEFIISNLNLIYNLFYIQLEKFNYEKGYLENNSENIIKLIKYHEGDITKDKDIEELRNLDNYIKYINDIIINKINMFLH
jgi:hypothetical protein